MRVLLSTIGSRGDVQPVVALASRVMELGHDARVCAPPDFREWVAGLGIPFVPIGPELRRTASSSTPAARTRPTPEQMRQIAAATVGTQFEVIPVAAEDCDVVLGAGALQIALRTVAEQRGIPYFYAGYCPMSLPSPYHAPPAWLGESPAAGPVDNSRLWAEDAQRWNDSWGVALNSHRTSAGLAPVTGVRDHIFGDRPLLAADPVLGPWHKSDLDVLQTGAWILPDQRSLSSDLEEFLDAGEPPVYFGFGSMPAAQGLAETMIATARAHGRRAIISRGWANLSLVDGAADCLSIGEVNQQALFPRVAAVVHHGGAGTTTAAARAGVPQVVVPQKYDQYYWAQRVDELGIGVAHLTALAVDSLTEALGHALRPEPAVCAEAVAGAVSADGTDVTARLLFA